MSSEVLFFEVRQALAEAVSLPVDSAEVDGLMRALDRSRLIRYHKGEGVALLSTAGKVLLAICEDPTLTQRAISVYLGCSEALVDKSVASLASEGLVTKTKVGRKNIYCVNVDLVFSHSDIQHWRGVVGLLEGMEAILAVAPGDEGSDDLF